MIKLGRKVLQTHWRVLLVVSIHLYDDIMIPESCGVRCSITCLSQKLAHIQTVNGNVHLAVKHRFRLCFYIFCYHTR